VKFSWSTAAAATGYNFRLGTTAGANNLFASGLITATSATPTGLPTNGETIYATLYTNYGANQVSNSYTFTASTQAALTSPTGGTMLASPSVTFSWSAATGSGVTGYNFRLGTTVGANNVYSSGLLSASTTSTSATGLPSNGETLYGTLYTNYGSVQVSTGYTFTSVKQAALTSPTGGSTLTGSSETFTWSAATGSGLTGYNFRLGTTVGANNVYSSGLLSASTTSVTPTGLPTNGETLYGTLYTNYGTVQVSTGYTFKAETLAAALTSPTASTFAGPTVTFSWAAAPGASGYNFRLGTTAGANNVYSSGLITATTTTATGLPTNGETIYATLYTNYGTVQVSNSYTFTAAKQAALTSPTGGGTLSGPSVTFTWSAATGSGVTGYNFRLGTTAGANNLYSSGMITATSTTATGLPTNGETIYATLYTDYGAVQVSTSYTFTAAKQAALTSPGGGSTLTGSSQTFKWSAATGSGLTGYNFRLGTTAGANDLYSSGLLSTSTTSVTPTGLPTNGETIYGTLYTDYYGTVQVSTSYTFTAAP
jgi:hypothetical protein